MSVFERFEKSVEGAVNGVFAKFGSKDLQTVDLHRALEEEIDASVVRVDRNNAIAPSIYYFKLSSADYETIARSDVDALVEELAENLTQYAISQRYTLDGPVSIFFERDETLDKSNIAVSSQHADPRSASDPVGQFAGQPGLPVDQAMAQGAPVAQPAAQMGAAMPAPVQQAPSAQQLANRPMVEINLNEYVLVNDVTIIGRERKSGCDIVIKDPAISSRHIAIEVTDQGVIARDLGSTNGMYVEGHQVPAVTLLNGNTITIGRTHILYWDSTDQQA